MPAHPFYTNFTAGAVTEKLDARTDFQKYANAARVIKNGVVLPQGGCSSRAGTIYLGPAKYNDKRCRLQAFQFSVDQSYIVEFGDLYARFWTHRGLVVDGSNAPVEVATPYTEAELRELRFEQSADVMYIGHPDHPPAKISRVTLTSFQYAVINFLPPPTVEAREQFAADLTFDSIAAGETFVTASSDTFLYGDVGRQIHSGASRAVLTNFVSATRMQIHILEAFTTPTVAAASWELDGSPNNTIINWSLGQPIFAFIIITADFPCFRATDVGKYVVALEGIAQIYQFDSSTQVRAQIVKTITTTPFTSTTDIIAGGWTLESSSWSPTFGYPGVPCLFQQRLWWAGSPEFPDTVWASHSLDYENMGRGALDSDAIVYILATSGVNMVRWMKGGGQRGLALGTIAGEMTLDGGTDQPLTPTNVQMNERTRYGTDFNVDALRVDHQHIFLQRGATRVRELAFKFTDDNFVAPDISILAEHLFRAQVVEMAYDSSPESIIFGVRQDGLMNLCTYERDQEVVAWSYAETTEDDDFESVAVIPNSCGDGDEVWVAVRRDFPAGASWWWDDDYWAVNYWAADYWADGEGVAAASVRYIEVFDGIMNTDSGLTWSGSSSSTFTGLNHLEGRDVRVIIDEGTEYDLTVAGGEITLPLGVTTQSIEIGLPWVMTLVTVRPDLAVPNGTIQGRRKRWDQITVRLYCSRGNILLNGEAMQYPELEDPTTLGHPFSGDMRSKTDFGWDRNGFIVVQRAEAKPCTITGITGALVVSDD